MQFPSPSFLPSFIQKLFSLILSHIRFSTFSYYFSSSLPYHSPVTLPSKKIYEISSRDLCRFQFLSKHRSPSPTHATSECFIVRNVPFYCATLSNQHYKVVVVFVLSAVKSPSLGSPTAVTQYFTYFNKRHGSGNFTFALSFSLPRRRSRIIKVIVHVDMIAWSNVFYFLLRRFRLNYWNAHQYQHVEVVTLFWNVEKPQFPSSTLVTRGSFEIKPFSTVARDRWRIRISRVKLWNSKLYDWLTDYPLLEMANKSTSHKYYFNPPRSVWLRFPKYSVLDLNWRNAGDLITSLLHLGSLCVL